MSIKQQVEDTIFLMENGRYMGALTTILLAIAASSMKVYPEGSISRNEHHNIKKTKCIHCGRGPSKLMRDGEKFTLFLSERLRKLILKDLRAQDEKTSGFEIEFNGNKFDIANVLYKFYRCKLVHEGELPEDVEFSAPAENPMFRVDTQKFSIGISVGRKLTLDYGWLELLVKSVVEAPCNGAEFGIEHYVLTPTHNLDDGRFVEYLVEKYNASHLIVGWFKEAIISYPEITTPDVDNETLAAIFMEHINSGNAHAFYLETKGLTDSSSRLSEKGLELIKELARNYDRDKT